MKYDVIVVGSGPAGAAAAADLAQRGRGVLLIDREVFPRDKACGGGVPPGSVKLLNDLGLGDTIRGAGFYPIHGIRIGSPRLRLWETDFRPRDESARFYVVTRSRFDQLIHQYAVESGAVFLRANVAEPVLEDGRVVGVRTVSGGAVSRYDGRVVIAADGAASVVTRALDAGFKRRPRDGAVAVRAYVEGLEILPHRVEFYFFRRFVPGYAWVFPLGEDRANVGVMIRTDRLLKKALRLHELLSEFLDIPLIKKRLRGGYRIENTAAWQLRFGSNRPEQRAFDGALAIGDAGGLVDPLTGEGIHNALVSARIAAAVADRAIQAGDVSRRALAEYDELVEESLGGSLKRSYNVQKWVGMAPWWVDLLFMFANANKRRFGSFLDRMSSDFVIDF